MATSSQSLREPMMNAIAERAEKVMA